MSSPKRHLGHSGSGHYETMLDFAVSLTAFLSSVEEFKYNSMKDRTLFCLVVTAVDREPVCHT